MKTGKAIQKTVVLLLVFSLMLGIAGCGNNQPVQQTKEPDSTPTGTEVVTEIAKEAPILADQVKAGTLPPLEERLPEATDVMIESDVMSLGEYGGSITGTANDAGRWAWGPYVEQSMFRFKQDGSGEVEPNVCKNYYPNDDSTVWTIELRKGMKWSDGKPFTADDVIFYYNHMSTPALNPDRSAVAVDAPGYYPAFTSKPYNCYQVAIDGVKYWATFDKVDDYKFTVTFKAPKPDFPVSVAVDNKWMFLPKHFYINYVARKDGVADDSTFPLITEEQALNNAKKDFGKEWENYSTMGKEIGYYHWDYAIVPQVRSFIAVKDNWNTVGQTYELVRNPYFWKVDSQGRQLPYLDSIKFEIINDNDQVALKQTAGEIDLSSVTASNYATVTQATQNTHTIVEWTTPEWSSASGALTLTLCQTVKDLDKRALFQDIRFREALSIAADRNLMNATLMNGQSKPAQAAVAQGAFGYDPEWTNKWTEYNVDKANTLLDQLTEPWDKTPGTYRKMKGTNKELEIIISISNPEDEGDMIALLQSAYKAIGIKISDKVDAELSKSILVNDVEASFTLVSVITPAIRPDSIVPMRNFTSLFGAYGKWYEDGKSTANGGIEPTGDILELVKAYDTLKAAAGPNRDQVVAENVQKIYNLHKENIWIIGFLSSQPTTWLANNKIKNFPSGVIWADEYRFASMMRLEQVYLSK